MVKHEILKLQTKKGQVTFVNIKDDLLAFIEDNNLQNGILSVQTPHTTCSILFEEMVHDVDFNGNEYLQVDLIRGLSEIFPRQLSENTYYKYPGPEHTQFGIDHDPEVSDDLSNLLNGDGHLRASLIGSSETFSVIDGVVQTGTWGDVYLIDWDQCRERERKCILTFVGE